MTTYYLWNYDEPPMSKVFGHMVRIAAPTLDVNKGDLFHDANMLSDICDGPCDFYFSVSDAGTEMNTDGRLFRDHQYHFTLTRERNDGWYLTIDVLAIPASDMVGRFVRFAGESPGIDDRASFARVDRVYIHAGEPWYALTHADGMLFDAPAYEWHAVDNEAGTFAALESLDSRLIRADDAAREAGQ